jgi:general secretion pathway protein K
MVDNLIAADAAAANTNTKTDTSSLSSTAPLKPYRMDQLVWLGLPQATLTALTPYATLLPVPTPVNLNTADVQVLQAALPNMPLAQAQQYVASRATTHFNNLTAALQAAGINAASAPGVDASFYSVGSHYFAVRGRLRLGDNAVQEVSLVERNGSNVKVVMRQREAVSLVATASLQ